MSGSERDEHIQVSTDSETTNWQELDYHTALLHQPEETSTQEPALEGGTLPQSEESELYVTASDVLELGQMEDKMVNRRDLFERKQKTLEELKKTEEEEEMRLRDMLLTPNIFLFHIYQQLLTVYCVLHMQLLLLISGL